jgi:hypothetical protein
MRDATLSHRRGVNSPTPKFDQVGAHLCVWGGGGGGERKC